MSYSYLLPAEAALPVVAVAIVLWILRKPTIPDHEKLLKSHPSVGLGNMWFAWTRAVLGSVLSTKSRVFEGYYKVSSPIISVHVSFNIRQ